MINRFNGTLLVARRELAATTITYNGVDYAAFGGGNDGGSKDTVDFMYLTTENS